MVKHPLQKKCALDGSGSSGHCSESLGWDAGIYKVPQVLLIQWDLGSLH